MDKNKHGRDVAPRSRPWGRYVLREYALIADGERGALIGPHGDLVWLCFPRWDDEAILATLLGGGGAYTISPTGVHVWGGHYEPGTLIWRSRWVTQHGLVECREALVYPGEPGRAVLLRSVETLDGHGSVQVWLDLRGDYGRQPARDLHRDGECWLGRLGSARFRWSGGSEAVVVRADGGPALSLTLDMPPRTRHDFVLEIATQPFPGPPATAAVLWEATEQGWLGDVPAMSETIAVRDSRHAYCVLRGLTSPRTGGMTAAATTSLPERAEQGRNYDYRYAWIRDLCYAGQAAAVCGGYGLLDDIVGFVAARLLADGPKLRPAYTIAGGLVPEESRLGLPGYPGGSDVVGNRVTQQFQLDAIGEALLLFAAAARADRLDADAAQAMEVAAAAIGERWRDPDAGIWELDDRFWTHSRLSCVAGLRAAARQRPGRRAAQWLEIADLVQAETTRRCMNIDGRWQRADDDPRLDAALLLPSIRGGLDPGDPRTRATLYQYLAELTEDEYAYRFRHDSRPLSEAEGAFLFCGYLVALALQQQGDLVAATRWFERNRAACGPPGLFSEEFDVEQRQLRGNLPQAFVHAIMLEASVRLAQAIGR